MLKRSRLPNDLTVQHVSSNDLEFLYHEIWEDSCYLQHGIDLQPGATVLDIGANIGLFSLAAAQLVGPQGKVIAAEPLPALHAALQHNIASHRDWCQQRGIQPTPIQVVDAGIGDGSAAEASFTLYTEAAGWSSMRPDDAEVEANMGEFLKQSLQSGSGTGRGWAAWLGRWLQALAPAWLWDYLWRRHVRRMLAARQHFTCRMCTVSDIIREHSLERIDLLKIDVERSEVDVLRGVSLDHWLRIRQVALEAHDTGGLLQEALQILKEVARFDSCVVEQAAALRGSSLYNVFCTRCPAEARQDDD